MDMRSILKMLKFGPLVPPQLKDDGDFAGNRSTEFTQGHRQNFPSVRSSPNIAREKLS